MKKTIDCKKLFGGYWKRGLAQEFVFEVPEIDNKEFADRVWRVFSRGFLFVSAVRLVAEGNKHEKWLKDFANAYENYLIPFGCAILKPNPDQTLHKVIKGDFVNQYPDSQFIRALFFDGLSSIGGYAVQMQIKAAIEQIKWINKPRQNDKIKYLPKICVTPMPSADTLEDIYKGGELTPENTFTIKGLSKAGKLFFLYICLCMRKDIQLKQYVETDRVFDVSVYPIELVTGVSRENIKGLVDAVKGMVGKYLLFRHPEPTAPNGYGWFATPVIITDPNLNLKQTGGKITRVKISKDFVTNARVRNMLTLYFNIEELTGLSLQEILKGAQDLDFILSLLPVLETWHKKNLPPMSYKKFIDLNGYTDNKVLKNKLTRIAPKLNHKLTFTRGGDWIWAKSENK